MTKTVYRFIADGIFALHFLIVLLVLFGWTLPSLWTIYVLALIITLLSDVIFGYCLLSKWEFDLRKKINPETDYNFTWATYYTHMLTDHLIPDHLIKKAAISFLVLSIAINLCWKFIV